MSNQEQEFTYESLQDRESVVRYLAALGEGLEKGTLFLASNGRSFSLNTPGLVKFDVQAKQKRNRAQLVIKMSWKNSKDAKELQVDPLSINGDEQHADS